MAASRQPMPVSRAAANVPPNLPSVATSDDQPADQPLARPESRSIRVRIPVKAKNAGSSRMVTTRSELAGQSPGGAAVVRDHRPQQKGAEDGVDADRLGGQGRQEQGHEDHRQRACGRAASSAQRRDDRVHERADHQEHERDEGQRCGGDERAPARPAPARRRRRRPAGTRRSRRRSAAQLRATTPSGSGSCRSRSGCGPAPERP